MAWCAALAVASVVSLVALAEGGRGGRGRGRARCQEDEPSGSKYRWMVESHSDDGINSFAERAVAPDDSDVITLNKPMIRSLFQAGYSPAPALYDYSPPAGVVAVRGGRRAASAWCVLLDADVASRAAALALLQARNMTMLTVQADDLVRVRATANPEAGAAASDAVRAFCSTRGFGRSVTPTYYLATPIVCGPVCAIFCQHGNVPDEDGCPTCTCKDAPVDVVVEGGEAASDAGDDAQDDDDDDDDESVAAYEPTVRLLEDTVKIVGLTPSRRWAMRQGTSRQERQERRGERQQRRQSPEGQARRAEKQQRREERRQRIAARTEQDPDWATRRAERRQQRQQRRQDPNWEAGRAARRQGRQERRQGRQGRRDRRQRRGRGNAQA